MSFILNEYQIDNAVRRFGHDDERPNLSAAVRTLDDLVDWTDHNSDGWPYWSAPAKASAKLQRLIAGVDWLDPQDISASDLRKAYIPIRSFRTRKNADFVIEEPA